MHKSFPKQKQVIHMLAFELKNFSTFAFNDGIFRHQIKNLDSQEQDNTQKRKRPLGRQPLSRF